MDAQVYITKFYLTQGRIFLGRVVGADEHFVWVEYPGGLNGKLMLRKGMEAFDSYKEATRRCQKLVSARLNSLEKQKDKLQWLWLHAVDEEVQVEEIPSHV